MFRKTRHLVLPISGLFPFAKSKKVSARREDVVFLEVSEFLRVAASCISILGLLFAFVWDGAWL